MIVSNNRGLIQGGQTLEYISICHPAGVIMSLIIDSNNNRVIMKVNLAVTMIMNI